MRVRKIKDFVICYTVCTNKFMGHIFEPITTDLTRLDTEQFCSVNIEYSNYGMNF